MTAEVHVLTDEQLGDAAGTPGLNRRVAFEGDDHWFGHVEAEAQTMSGWHHHGEMVTLGYVLRGRVRLEFGPGGRRSVEAGAGEYLMVPARLIHREGNAGDEPAEIVLVRLGEGPPVFPVDGPEPA